jgi:hypothetical protein
MYLNYFTTTGQILTIILDWTLKTGNGGSGNSGNTNGNNGNVGNGGTVTAGEANGGNGGNNNLNQTSGRPCGNDGNGLVLVVATEEMVV